jgi:hypothetical protein
MEMAFSSSISDLESNLRPTKKPCEHHKNPRMYNKAPKSNTLVVLHGTHANESPYREQPYTQNTKRRLSLFGLLGIFAMTLATSDSFARFIDGGRMGRTTGIWLWEGVIVEGVVVRCGRGGGRGGRGQWLGEWYLPRCCDNLKY